MWYTVYTALKEEFLIMFKIDLGNIKTIEDKEKCEEKLSNRIVLNFVYSLAAFVLLFIFYRFSTGFRGTNTLVIKPTWTVLIVMFFVFLAASVGFHIAAAKIKDASKKSLVKNHAHMLLGFAVGTFIVNFHKYLAIFLPIESTSGIIRKLTEPFRNIYFNFRLVSILTAIVFVLLMIYNFYVSRKLASITKKSLAKSK